MVITSENDSFSFSYSEQILKFRFDLWFGGSQHLKQYEKKLSMFLNVAKEDVQYENKNHTMIFV